MWLKRIPPKDVILHLTGELTVKGGTGYVLEYFGDGVSSLSTTAMATICNMGAEMGATTSVFQYSPAHLDYLKATHRADLAALVESNSDLLQADEGCSYDNVIEIDLSQIKPAVNGPFTPDLSHTVTDGAFGRAVAEHGWPREVKVGLIGSCTNSRSGYS